MSILICALIQVVWMGGLARLSHQETIFPHISLLYIPALTRNTHCHCTLNLNDLDSSRHLAHPGTLTKNDLNNSIWELAENTRLSPPCVCSPIMPRRHIQRWKFWFVPLVRDRVKASSIAFFIGDYNRLQG